MSGLSGGCADIKEIRACSTSYRELNAHVAGIPRPFVPCISCDTSKQPEKVLVLCFPHDSGLPRSWAAVSSRSVPLPRCSITKRGVMGVDDLPAARTQTQNIGATRELHDIPVIYCGNPPSICDGTAQSGKSGGHDGGAREARGTRWVLGRVGAMAPCWVWWVRPIRGGAGSNVIRRWCGRGSGVCVQRGLVCGVGGLNKVGARHVGASWRRLG